MITIGNILKVSAFAAGTYLVGSFVLRMWSDDVKEVA